MASFRDPARTFAPIEVVERLLEILEIYGERPVLYLTSDGDLASYLDSFGFDIYSLTTDTDAPFSTSTRSALVLPSGSRLHGSATKH